MQIQLPLLDFGRHAHARETAADAAKAKHQVTWMQQQQREACSDLRRSLLELLAQLKLAGLEYEIAASELAGIETQANNQAAASSAVTPKEIYRARMQAGQKLLDRLTVAAQLQETYVHYLRQNGTLETWIVDGAEL